MSTIWDILEIEPTKDEDQIKKSIPDKNWYTQTRKTIRRNLKRCARLMTGCERGSG